MYLHLHYTVCDCHPFCKASQQQNTSHFQRLCECLLPFSAIENLVVVWPMEWRPFYNDEHLFHKYQDSILLLHFDALYIHNHVLLQ